MDLDASGYYTSYAFEFGQYPGFYRIGVNQLDLYAETAATTTLDFSPYGSIGIGRLHSITRLKEIELAMRHLGIEPTVERLEAAANVRYSRDAYLNRFSEYNTINHVTYYQDLADAYGASDKMLEFLYLDRSQQYLFDRARYQGMLHGWEATASLRPTIDYRSTRPSPSTHLYLNLDLEARYAAFAMDDMLHYQGRALLSPGMTMDGNTAFSFRGNLNGQVRYLPPSVPWYVVGVLNMDYNTTATPRKFRASLNGSFNYLITPNFTTFAGLQLDINRNYSATTRLVVNAGGSIRIW
ncbi:MAG: hypothetical protein EOM15_12515 [Spirochaetia bacterium]|nr:hypothetical protein [Spirochaetia bacterium]